MLPVSLRRNKKKICIVTVFATLFIVASRIKHGTWKTKGDGIRLPILHRNDETESFDNPELVIDGSDVCTANQTGRLDLLIVVVSPVENFVQRDDVRNSWAAKIGRFDDRPIRFIFLMDQTSDFIVQSLIEEESGYHSDVVQANHTDSANAALRRLFLFGWIRKNCRNARYVMRCDDDTFVNVAKVSRMIDSEKETRESDTNVIFAKMEMATVNDEETTVEYVNRDVYAIGNEAVRNILDSCVPPLLKTEILLNGLCLRTAKVSIIRVERFWSIIDESEVSSTLPRNSVMCRVSDFHAIKGISSRKFRLVSDVSSTSKQSRNVCGNRNVTFHILIILFISFLVLSVILSMCTICSMLCQ
ncbi:Uncharacterised protein g2877 [Pycnogonum litorale]